MFVLEGLVGTVVGYSTRDGKFAWLPFSLSMDKAYCGTRWADLVGNVAQKCTGVRVMFFIGRHLTDNLFLSSVTSINNVLGV
jgi:hypothetical protein